MKKFIVGFGWLVSACAAVAATGTSNEFRIDTRRVKVARATEPISYSTAWATNLTAGGDAGGATHEIKAVVKVNPCLKTPPKYLVVDMSGGRSAARWPISYLDEVPEGGWTDEYKTGKLVLRYIPAGSFIMGRRATDYPGAVNINLHMVTLTKPFYIGVFECTQRQWELAMGTRPSAFSNETCYATRPVEQVSYADIRGSQKGICWPDENGVDGDGFMWMLRQKTALHHFDLPTEAQWEYACRAGTTTALSTGENLSAMSNSVEVTRLARYAFNSGWAVDYYLTTGDGYKWTDTNCLADKGTAKVGSYPVNPWGLYDMEGNVSEICLDVYTNTLVECIDPIGPSSSISDRRIYRGGAWRFPAWCSVSGFRIRGDLAYNSRPFSCGFRICLHDANVYPSADSATVLVNASGAATADWTPTQAGTYLLTHEVQTNGVTVGAFETALFKVEGPELEIVLQGELTNGVAVAIEGAGDWPVYYTTDGSAPTAASTLYEGPFSLPESATVKAVAISAGGVTSEAASATLTLHDALGVVGAVARPRYPWNGKVDVDCEVKGDAGQRYLVSLEALDILGGTNLPVRTVGRVAGKGARQGTGDASGDEETRDGETGGGFVVGPGKYRFVWDAAADIAGDNDFARVAVTVKATGSYLLAYPKTLDLTVSGYTGTEVLTNVPTLVRLSTAIKGFSYADFATTNGADLVFFDADEHPLLYEIDEWNTNGESLVWVKLPTLANGTRFVCAYGAQSNNRTIEQSNNPHAVWADYAGVWHMNEPSGTAFDSTEHHLDGIPSCGTNELADVSQMVAYEKGACGKARINAPNALSGGNYLETPSYDALRLGNRFVISGWFLFSEYGRAEPLFMRDYKSNSNGDHICQGWCVEHWTNREGIIVMGATNHNASVYIGCDAVLTSKWTNVTIVYANDNATVYVDGVCVAEGQILPPTDNGLPMTLGSGAFGACGGNQSLGGQYDEIRLRDGTLSPDRIKTDYDMIANRGFLRYGGEAGAAQRPADATGDEIGVRGDVMTIDVSGGETAAAYKVEYFTDVDIGVFNCAAYKTSKIVLRKVPAGTYAAKPGASGDIGDATLTTRKDYWIGIFPVTQRQWDNVMGAGNPRLPYNRAQSTDGADEVGMRPRDYVSWNELRFGDSTTRSPAVPVGEGTFFGRLNAKTGLSGFDLPTEAQWEIAARAGSTAEYGSYWKDGTAFTADGSSEVQKLFAWFSGNQRSVSGAYTHPVGKLCPNLWGLYDTAGNVWEYCLDSWVYPYSDAYVDSPYCSDISKDERGGCYIGNASTCRPSSRTSNGTPGGYDGCHGFRLARTAE